MTPAGALALKLILTPVLVGGASVAGRRWGSGVGGWLIGMPFTSAPIAFFLALDPGPRFAAGAAAGIMAGTASQAAFCLAYSWVAQRSGWAASLAAAAIAFAAATIVLDTFILPAPAFFVVTIVVLVVSLFLMPGQATRSARQVDFPRWDIPARMFVATAFVVALFDHRLLAPSAVAPGIIALGLGAAMLIVANYAVAGRIAWTPGANAILFGRMLQAGTGSRARLQPSACCAGCCSGFSRSLRSSWSWRCCCPTASFSPSSRRSSARS